MRIKFFLTISIFFFGVFVNVVSAQTIPADIRPDLCNSGMVQVNVDEDNVACLPSEDFDAEMVQVTGVNQYRVKICRYENWNVRTTSSASTDVKVCCPAGWTAYRNTAAGGTGISRDFCCPQTHPLENVGGDYWCKNSSGDPYTPGSTIDVPGVDDPIPTSNFGKANGTLDGSDYIHFIDEFRQFYPEANTINRTEQDIYWCPDREYYCVYRGDWGPDQYRGPSFSWSYDQNYDPFANIFSDASQTPSGREPFARKDGFTTGVPECQKTCSSRSRGGVVGIGSTDWICLPQIGWAPKNDDWKNDLNITNLLDPDSGETVSISDIADDYIGVENMLCENGSYKDLISNTIDRDEATQGGCGNIITYRNDTGDLLFRSESEFPDLYQEYESCLLCQGTVENPTGNLWTELGCIEPTASGVVTRIFQIAVGIAGAVIIFRIIQTVIVMNTQSDNPEAMNEARENIVSIVVFIVVVTGAVAILRFLAQNLLNLDIPIFG